MGKKSNQLKSTGNHILLNNVLLSLKYLYLYIKKIQSTTIIITITINLN